MSAGWLTDPHCNRRQACGLPTRSRSLLSVPETIGQTSRNAVCFLRACLQNVPGSVSVGHSVHQAFGGPGVPVKTTQDDTTPHTGWSTGPFLYFAHTAPHAGGRAGLPTVSHQGALRPRVSMQPTLYMKCFLNISVLT